MQMAHRAFGFYRRGPPRHSPGGPTRLFPMGWPLVDTDQAEGPSPTQIDHRHPLRAEGGHLRCLLNGPRFRKVSLTAKTSVIRPTWGNREIE